MEVIVALVWLIYHDAASIGLELEIGDAVNFYVLNCIGEALSSSTSLTSIEARTPGTCVMKKIFKTH